MMMVMMSNHLNYFVNNFSPVGVEKRIEKKNIQALRCCRRLPSHFRKMAVLASDIVYIIQAKNH